MDFHPKIVLIYALLSLQRRESNLRAFLIQNFNFARLFARLTPVFLLNKAPVFYKKMSPSEEFATLSTHSYNLYRIFSSETFLQKSRWKWMVMELACEGQRGSQQGRGATQSLRVTVLKITPHLQSQGSRRRQKAPNRRLVLGRPPRHPELWSKGCQHQKEDLCFSLCRCQPWC